MNRFNYLKGLPRPAVVFHDIKVGKIWRGIKCDANPMLIQIVGESEGGKWSVVDQSWNAVGFEISTADLVRIYCPDPLSEP